LSSNASSYNGSFHYHAVGSGANVATFSFTGLTPGTYRVFATWLQNANRGTNVPYTLNNGSTQTTVTVNQQVAPTADVTAGSRPFKNLGTVTITGTTITVSISDNSTGLSIADAVRIECP
jgi:hypothetical protein